MDRHRVVEGMGAAICTVGGQLGDAIITEARKERIIHMVIRRLMKEVGMTCLGTGCG